MIFWSFYGCNSIAQPYAEWSDLSGVDKTITESFNNARNKNIPTINEIEIPSYPGSKLLRIDDYICEKQISSLILVTTSQQSDVVTWYEMNLIGFPKSLSESKVFFIEDYDNFKYESNSTELLNRQYVSIMEINDTMKRVAPEYNTFIEVGFDTYKIRRCNKQN